MVVKILFNLFFKRKVVYNNGFTVLRNRISIIVSFTFYCKITVGLL